MGDTRIMITRKPLREKNLKEFVREVLDRLPEMSLEDVEEIAIAAEQILLDSEVDDDGNYLN